MTSIANWSYVHKCTIWRKTGVEGGYNKPVYATPEIIMCDYGFDAKLTKDASGNEIAQKNTFWTEYQLSGIGDYIILGEFTELDPLEVNADQVVNVINYGNTLELSGLPDFALVTGR